MIAIEVIPARAKVNNFLKLFLLNMSFIFIVICMAFIFYSGYPKKYNKSLERTRLSNLNLLKYVNLVSYASIIGILLVAFDRIFIRKINYSLGLRAARYVWLKSTGGSIPSVIGNLLVSFGYICIVFLVIYYNELTRRKVALLIIAAISSIVGHAALNGGRSNLLIAMFVFYISFQLRKKKKIELRKKTSIKIPVRNIVLFLILIISLYYISVITMSSAKLGNIGIMKLTLLGIENLYGVVTDNFFKYDVFSDLIYLLIYFVAYLFHGQWTAQIAMTLPYREGNYSFYAYAVILKKIGILNTAPKEGYFSSTGAFISLPGAFYYDFGYIGFILMSMILGFLLGYALVILNHKNTITFIDLAYIYFILLVLYMSPIVPAYGMIYLNFIIGMFIFLGIFNRYIIKNKSSII